MKIRAGNVIKVKQGESLELYLAARFNYEGRICICLFSLYDGNWFSYPVVAKSDEDGFYIEMKDLSNRFTYERKSINHERL